MPRELNLIRLGVRIPPNAGLCPFFIANLHRLSVLKLAPTESASLSVGKVGTYLNN